MASLSIGNRMSSAEALFPPVDWWSLHMYWQPMQRDVTNCIIPHQTNPSVQIIKSNQISRDYRSEVLPYRKVKMNYQPFAINPQAKFMDHFRAQFLDPMGLQFMQTGRGILPCTMTTLFANYRYPFQRRIG